ncbi:hypothetical protein GGQ80_000792 [Sphingomonas jinjuensis]|uniref:DUF3168 domain-containing protein n=1 Tax=Sphingomonas jinjuensis TaxID=535907 RepID=A0A840FAU9_9SPHN|nr:hypothetical protein [Sphingomonas jinjuensis]MBB4152904.1 hypothetical protein [Sphingomonas jinjuensis]
MTVIVDTLTGAQDAIVALLQDRLPPDQRELVYATIPQDTPAPFFLIGDIDVERVDDEGQLDRASVDVHAIHQGNRRDLLARMHLVRVAAHGQTVLIDGAAYRVTWQSSAASTAAADGVTFAGLIAFDLFAYPS